MIANYLYGGKFVPTEAALLITVALIGGAILLSLMRTRGTQATDSAALRTGWVPGSLAGAAPDKANKQPWPNA